MTYRPSHNSTDDMSHPKPGKRARTKDNKRKSVTNRNSADLTESQFESESSLLDDSWISATSTYNYMMKDPLLDWLKHHHNSFVHRHRRYRELVNKSIECVNEGKSSYNFTSYIMEQGHEFERKVMKLLTKKFGPERVVELHGEEAPRNPAKAEETFEAMKRGVPIIHSGVLHNHKNKTFGIPDLLVRSDWLKFLVNEAPISQKLETKSAPELGKKWHYCVVDVKFTGLLLRADATHLLNSASFPAYKAQLLIYNWALGELQGYTPDQVYILGRRWKYTARGETFSGNSCFDKFGIIDYHTSDWEYVTQTEKALKWIREVRSDEAADWNIIKYPLDRWELYPNMCNHHDHPWHAVKEEIAEQSKELTNLWMVGPKNRNIALKEGICQWTDEECTPDVLGITGEKTSEILEAIIKINQSTKDKILPKYIGNNINAWKASDTIEFFVDFETCNGVVSSIKKLPLAQTETIVFMIGVGYIDPTTRKWIYRHFTVNYLTFTEEARICKEFSDFIREKAKEYKVKQPQCIHWAQAEDIMWSDAVERHDPISNEWKSWMWDWLDLLVVFKEEPIVINGCMSFGLKAVASAMKRHGFIKSSWNKKSICVDGQSAMIAALKANKMAREAGTSMLNIPIMKQIIKYNEVDVRVLYEIITYLRKNHVLWSRPYKPIEEFPRTPKHMRKHQHTDEEESTQYKSKSKSKSKHTNDESTQSKSKQTSKNSSVVVSGPMTIHNDEEATPFKHIRKRKQTDEEAITSKCTDKSTKDTQSKRRKTLDNGNLPDNLKPPEKRRISDNVTELAAGILRELNDKVNDSAGSVGVCDAENMILLMNDPNKITQPATDVRHYNLRKRQISDMKT